jgi:hypothetical protein
MWGLRAIEMGARVSLRKTVASEGLSRGVYHWLQPLREAAGVNDIDADTRPPRGHTQCRGGAAARIGTYGPRGALKAAAPHRAAFWTGISLGQQGTVVASSRGSASRGGVRSLFS